MVVTVTAEGAVSGFAAADADLFTPSAPLTEPLVDVGGPVAPPALAEVNEYNEEVDMRLLSPLLRLLLVTDSGLRAPRSGSADCLLASDILRSENRLGASYSSTADSLIVLLVPSVSRSLASLSFLLTLIVEEALLLIEGLGRGMEKETLSA